MNIIKSSEESKELDMSLSLAAKQRSIHNNYSTFLVLFIMLSGHYSFLVYHKYNWLILCLIGIISVVARHYFNYRGRNINKPRVLFASIIALIVLAGIICKEQTTISRIYHLDRGYEKIENKLRKIGVNIKRLS